jgi:hypothetical protein
VRFDALAKAQRARGTERLRQERTVDGFARRLLALKLLTESAVALREAP